jgi:hypothetical protein
MIPPILSAELRSAEVLRPEWVKRLSSLRLSTAT